MSTITKKKIKLTITDTLAIFNDAAGDYLFNPSQSATHDYWFQLPASWYSGNEVREDNLERIFQFIYGQNWRSGNGDGSRYIVLRHEIVTLGNPVPAEIPRAVNAKCYQVDVGGNFVRISKSEF